MFIVPADRIDEFRQLLDELNHDVSGLAEGAHPVGYQRERMLLRYNADGDARCRDRERRCSPLAPAAWGGTMGAAARDVRTVVGEAVDFVTGSGSTT